MRRRRDSSIAIVFETHSTTTDNERWIASGWLDGQLSLAGRRQANELRQRRGNEELAAVFTSDLGRAVETAQLAFGGLGIPIFHDWRLRECDYGELNGTPVARLEAQRSLHVYEPYPEGESYSQVVFRVQSFLRDLSPRFEDERIVVVGHSATQWALQHLLEGTPLPELVEGSFRWQPGWLYTLVVDS
ncbi:MAG: histidine phosphatase family protein [Thermoleophilia bacterium]|nr:histidine phosphatase family protein [Thermoleophilia bacterium]MDH4341354.1 histidine phosphatase family protein [Thermoleophilia bacterium]MDH5281710.1 histidine phosphatase family protein [Thermoleophilia bacterium]